MMLLERHLLYRILSATASCLVFFVCLFWIIESLRKIDIVTSAGQTILTLQIAVLLSLPGRMELVAPFAFLIGLAGVLMRLNADNEFTVIVASGASRRVVFRPILVAATIMALFIAFVSVFLAPLSTRNSKDFGHRVRADVINEHIGDGNFHALDGDKLVIGVRSKNSDGSLQDVFIQDTRDESEARQYLAASAAVVRESPKSFLILSDGTLIREIHADGAIEIVDFQSYAIDVSPFLRSAVRTRRSLSERTLKELINPDTTDSLFRRNPHALSAEFHKRLSDPFYPFAIAALLLAVLGRPRSGRRDRVALTILAFVVCIGVLALGMVAFGALNSGRAAWPVVYLVPLAGAAAGTALVITNPRLYLPGRILGGIVEAAGRLWPERRSI